MWQDLFIVYMLVLLIFSVWSGFHLHSEGKGSKNPVYLLSACEPPWLTAAPFPGSAAVRGADPPLGEDDARLHSFVLQG